MKTVKLKPLFVAIATSLVAQGVQAADARVDDGVNESYERIVVTGSRIARAGADTTAPVTVVTAEELSISGSMNLNEMLATLPQFQGINASTDAYNPENAGLNTVDLRDLGAVRTLVLINGHRPTQTANSSDLFVTDVSNIPASLVDRVEILTGGASAVYGSDAVAGVVNIILKKEFEGVEVDLYGSTTEKGDAEQTGVTITSGFNFDDSKGNIAVSLDYLKENELRYADRSGSYGQTNFVANKLDPRGSIAGIPDQVTLNNIGWADYNVLAQRPTIMMDNYDYYQFGRNSEGELNNGFLAITDAELYDYYKQSTDVNPYMYSSVGPIQAVVPKEKYSVYLNGSYEFDNGLFLSGDVQYSRIKSKQNLDPEFVFSWNGWINVNDAPFDVPQAVRDTVENDNNGSDWFAVPYTFNDLGNRETEVDREYVSASVTLEGEVFDEWLWDAYAATGKTSKDATSMNRVNTDRFYAFETFGECEATNSCPEFNPFMPLTDELMDYVRIDPFTDTTTTFQHTVAANINGPAMMLPAGELMLGAGVEYRQEGLEVDPSSVSLSGINRGNTKTAQDVDRDIAEAYVEVLVPVVADMAFAESIDIEAAYRVANYTYAGTNDSWKFGVNWAVNDDVRVRSVYAKAVRAPQLTELFSPEETSFFRMSDPCDADEIPFSDDPELRTANCAALGVPADFESELRVTGGSYGSTKGNEELDPEVAHTLTAGLVLSPSAVDNLVISFDYFNIEIEDVIGRFGAEDFAERCVDADTINNPFCGQVTREADGNISYVNDTYVNSAKMIREGVDFQVNYGVDISGNSNIDFALYGTYLTKSTWQDTVDTEEYDYVGVVGVPEWKTSFNTQYYIDKFSASWQINFVSSTKVSRTATAEKYDRPELPSSILHNARLGYEFSDTINAYVGVTNVFDQDWLGIAGASSGGTTYPIRGRSYNAGLTLQF